MFVRFYAFQALEGVSVRVKSVDEFKAGCADDGVFRPVQIQIGISLNRRKTRMFRRGDPLCVREWASREATRSAANSAWAFNSGTILSPSATGSSSGQTGVKVFCASISKAAINCFAGKRNVNMVLPPPSKSEVVYNPGQRMNPYRFPVRKCFKSIIYNATACVKSFPM